VEESGMPQQVYLTKQTVDNLGKSVATAVINALKQEEFIATPAVKPPKTAYQKTEQLLYNYNGFKRIVAEKQREIEELREYGVPQKSGSIVEYSPHGGTVQGTVLPEESVENAVRNVEASVQGTVEAIALIDKCMALISTDPYYKILEYRYFDGRTQEDIAAEFNCSQVTISNNKNRLVRELSMRLFPDQVVDEMFK
jgi:DNA-directed RNA polymerase specialized sigma subunit